jgi:uncharacterized PurR-regulated membrane protein YhhQ (DUF165 family)
LTSQSVNNNKSIDTLNINPKFLWFIILSYSMLSLLSNWFSICTISLQEIPVNAGMLIYSCTFLISNFITEIYGYKHARRAVWCGFSFNILSILYGSWIIHLPSPSYSVNNSLFDLVIISYLKSVFIFIISYFAVEPFNIFFSAKLKLNLNGNYMRIRLALVSLFSIIMSGTIFKLLIVNIPLIDVKLIPTLFITMTIVIIFLPIAVYLIKKVKQIEQIDIYDQNTRFNIFKFEVNYTANNNEFNKLSI